MGLLAALVAGPLSDGALGAEAPAAKIRVQGFGWLKNRELRQSLDLLIGDGTRRPTVDASFLEDASLVLNSELVEAGFFGAEVEVFWRDAAGVEGSARLDPELSRPLPRPLEVTEARLVARLGLRAVVESVEFEGLTAINEEDARDFFQPDAGLYTPAQVRAYSEARVRRALAQLREALRARGYAEARVEAAETRLDERTGEVALRIRVEEGPRWRVAAWRAEVSDGGELPGGEPARLVGEVWTAALARDLGQAVRRRYYALGHADVAVGWSPEPGERVENGERAVTAVARVEPGPAWRFGDVRFEGLTRTRPELLEERVRLERGRPFDPEAVDAARLRLARLGVFRRLDAEGAPAAEAGVRDLVFRAREEPPWEASFLLGYGSYEQLRGAVELRRENLWGLAHHDRVELAQSLKATRGEYRYTVPTLFRDTVEGSARVFGLRREEPSFLRLEYGGGVEASREVPWIRARGTAGLSYEVLRADDVALGAAPAEVREAAVSAVDLGLTRDTRDNPVRPTRGHRWSLRSQTATSALGSEVDYERVELALAWHRPLDGERWVHAGFSHGIVASGDDVPVNRLFFPGGESSIRGFVEGEATQRDASGRFVGVRNYWLFNLEFEQRVTGRWTAVVFSDTLGSSVELEDWPGDEVLTTLGLGVRYQSPIGPLRLEYGRNLNPRAGDPDGTLHFSIGFPF